MSFSSTVVLLSGLQILLTRRSPSQKSSPSCPESATRRFSRAMTKVREQLRESFRALGEVYRNRGLRRLQLAWAGSIIGTWAFSVALAVYAYRQGGASAVGLVVV